MNADENTPTERPQSEFQMLAEDLRELKLLWQRATDRLESVARRVSALEATGREK